MDYLEYKGYKGSVEYSKADNCLVGKVLGMSGDLIAYEGNTIDELRQDFEAGIDSYLEACEADGVKPNIPFRLAVAESGFTSAKRGVYSD